MHNEKSIANNSILIVDVDIYIQIVRKSKKKYILCYSSPKGLFNIVPMILCRSVLYSISGLMHMNNI